MTEIQGATLVYVDGGCIKRNPSHLGGTWAARFVGANGGVIEEVSGIVTPADIGLSGVTNNVTELLAAVEALERLPIRWQGTLYTDSQVTRIRLTRPSPAMNGVPKLLAARMWAARKRMGPLRLDVELLDGHPTQEQLEAGIGKRGHPVSIHNVWCDKECGRLAKDFLSLRS